MFRMVRTSIAAQYVAMTIGLIFLTGAVIVGVMHYNLRQYVLQEAATDARDASRNMAVLLAGDIEGSKIDIASGTLVSVQAESVSDFVNHSLVDRTAQSIAGVATIFRREGADYLRVSTNVKKEDGSRAVGTRLAADHPAQAALARGEAYYGPAELFGKQFMTGYFPIKAQGGANVGTMFIGIPMEVYFAKIHTLQVMAVAAGLFALLAFGALAYATVRRSVRPLRSLIAAVRDIADGRLEAEVPCLDKANEFGQIARALEVFRDNAVRKISAEREAAARQEEAARERTRADGEKQQTDREISFAVDELATGLGRLAQGDVSRGIDSPFAGRLDDLRRDFNASLARLQDTLLQIRANAASIQQSGGDMRQSAEALSRRTESQAASLEETAAAVEEITVTVRASADRAQEANLRVTETRRTADESGLVVSSAIAAMGRIEEASRKIEQIIEVIDDIAFQTNLLALNAGIEAARAGDAGKGFAVVAQEVRELAQRSAEAAREIKSLIERSTQEVEAGSRLVQDTGAVLSTISAQVAAVSQHVETIATASRDQSAALQEVNTSVNHMDQMTQQNASMVESTSASSRKLADEADALMALVAQFRLAEQGSAARRYAA